VDFSQHRREVEERASGTKTATFAKMVGRIWVRSSRGRRVDWIELMKAQPSSGSRTQLVGLTYIETRKPRQKWAKLE
jgi:hypothetical protein